VAVCNCQLAALTGWIITETAFAQSPLAESRFEKEVKSSKAYAEIGAPASKSELPAAEHGKPADFATAIAPLPSKHCTSCHGGEDPKGDLSLAFGNRQAVDERLRG
jgi:hypothetical protein